MVFSPANGELHYTIRTWNSEYMQILRSKVEQKCKEICVLENLQFDCKWFEHFPASKNHLNGNQYISEAAIENELELIERPFPFTFGEDFGWFF